MPSALQTDPNALQTDPNNESSNNGHYWLSSFLRQQIGNGISNQPIATEMTDIELTDNELNRSEVNSKNTAYQTDKRTQHTHNLEEHLYLQDAARIPYAGMQQVLYPDLTMTIALGGQKGRDSAYLHNFKSGLAQWYHLPQSTFLNKYKQHIVNEIRYLALAITSDEDSHSKQIAMIWPNELPTTYRGGGFLGNTHT